MQDERADFYELAFLAAVWAIVIAVVHPQGNFPVIDDWDFAIATWNYARTGHFHFTAFTAVSLRAMVLWGAAWTRLFGESFDVLRASTLTLSLSTILIVDRTLAQAQIVRGARILASLALLFHPLFLWSSCTYMTEVPFLFASSVALYAFLRALQEARYGWLLAGCAAVMTAWFVRENGVVLLLPPLLLLLWRREKIARHWRAFVVTIGVFLAVFAALFFFKRDWLAGTPAMLTAHYHVWLESTFRLPDQVTTLFRYVAFNAQNCAVFFLPLTLPLLAPLRGIRRREAMVLTGIAVVLALRALELGLGGYFMPYHSTHLYSEIQPGNLFINFGVGTPMLFDTAALNLPYPFTIPVGATVALTAFSVVVAALLVWVLLPAGPRPIGFQLPALSAEIFTLALFASGYYYDRYSLDSGWMLVLALPLVVPWERRVARTLAAVALVAMAFFSTFAVQEHFRWQRGRWTAWRDLRAQGVDLTEIDAGPEAMMLYEFGEQPVGAARRTHPMRRYEITFHPLDGYRVVKSYPFTSFLGMRHGQIYVLERINA